MYANKSNLIVMLTPKTIGSPGFKNLENTSTLVTIHVVQVI